MPTVTEIEENITSCYSGLPGVGNTLDSGESSGGLQVVHQVIMFDELAIEQRVHWEDSTNKFLGICHDVMIRTLRVMGLVSPQYVFLS